MENVFCSLQWETLLIYLDDIIMEGLEEVFKEKGSPATFRAPIVGKSDP